MKNDCRDWFVMLLVAAAWAFASAYLWKHASTADFGIWAGVCGTLTAVYHWLNIRDSKEKDGV
ncbi:MAG TPA: hypothetical protein VNH41_04820 [Steroidobacteraceae bacterium]|nr:hypothetical protein [Steroidobacteraceae bacterium]